MAAIIAITATMGKRWEFFLDLLTYLVSQRVGVVSNK